MNSGDWSQSNRQIQHGRKYPPTQRNPADWKLQKCYWSRLAINLAIRIMCCVFHTFHLRTLSTLKTAQLRLLFWIHDVTEPTQQDTSQMKFDTFTDLHGIPCHVWLVTCVCLVPSPSKNSRFRIFLLTADRQCSKPSASWMVCCEMLLA